MLNGEIENILESMIDKTEYDEPTRSRIGKLLLELKEVIETGGGGIVDLNNYVQKTDYATSTTAGASKINNFFGVSINNSGTLYIYKANNEEINFENNDYHPLVPSSIPIFMSRYDIDKNTIQEISNRITVLETKLKEV